MVNWNKMARLAGYASMALTNVSLVLHFYVLYAREVGKLELSENAIGNYVRTVTLNDVYDWIIIDLIRLSTTYLLIRALQKHCSEALYFWVEFKAAVTVVFSAILISKLANNKLDKFEIFFPALSVATSIPLVVCAQKAWHHF